jgi:hypothetical protein
LCGGVTTLSAIDPGLDSGSQGADSVAHFPDDACPGGVVGDTSL